MSDRYVKERNDNDPDKWKSLQLGGYRLEEIGAVGFPLCFLVGQMQSVCYLKSIVVCGISFAILQWSLYAKYILSTIPLKSSKSCKVLTDDRFAELRGIQIFRG